MFDMTALAVPVKTCAGPCGQRLPWTEYHAKTRWDDGTMRRPHSYCKACQNDYCRAWQDRKAKADPTWRARKSRESYASMRRDPDRWADYLAYSREFKRRKRGSVHERLRPSVDGRSPSVDAGPFARWLDSLVADVGSVRVAAAVCGMSEARVSKIRAGDIPRVELSSVDAALQSEGSTMIESLYPLERAAT